MITRDSGSRCPTLRGSGAIEGQPEGERQAFAERALGELYADGFIYFFRVANDGDVNAAGRDDESRLSDEEVEQALSDEWWRRREGFPADAPDIWFGATPEGYAIAKAPPSEVRTLLGLGGPAND
jgi:hypothetical protein